MNSAILTRLQQMYDEHEHLAYVFKENLLIAKDRFKDNEVDYVNEDGKTVQVKEKLLWDELWYSPKGRESQAGKLLMAKYPDIFEYEDKVNAKKKEIQEYEVQTFGFKGSDMRLIDFINLIDKIVEFRMQKYEKEEKNIEGAQEEARPAQ